MEPIGPKLAEGRDSEIFEHGPGRVLRRARNGRSLELEARTMTYAREHGYPVPRVHDAGDGYLVMDRVEGRTLMARAMPGHIPSSAKLLARLHEQLHAIPAPDWVPDAGVPGDRLVHRDLHPLNVLLSPDGPVVIDWSNAARGGPSYDVADTWVLLACADPEGLSPIERVLAPPARTWFLRTFLGQLDRAAARRAIPAVVEHRIADRNMTSIERDRMRALAARARAAS